MSPRDTGRRRPRARPPPVSMKAPPRVRASVRRSMWTNARASRSPSRNAGTRSCLSRASTSRRRTSSGPRRRGAAPRRRAFPRVRLRDRASTRPERLSLLSFGPRSRSTPPPTPSPTASNSGGLQPPAQPGCAEHRARDAPSLDLRLRRSPHRPNLFREGVWGGACAIPRGGRARASLLSARASEGCRNHPRHPRGGDARASHAAHAPLKPPRVSGKPKKCFERVWEVLVR